MTTPTPPTKTTSPTAESNRIGAAGWCAIILATALGAGWATTVIAIALRGVDVDHQGIDLLNGLGQVLAGAVATFIGTQIHARSKRE